MTESVFILSDDKLEVDIQETTVTSQITEDVLEVDMVDVTSGMDISPDALSVDIIEEALEVNLVEDNLTINFTECIQCPDAPAPGPDNGSLGIEVFSGKLKTRKRWLHYAGKPSNVVGLPIFVSCNLSNIVVQTKVPGSGWVHIQKNGENYFSIEMVSQDKKTVIGITKAFEPGDELQVYVESLDGLQSPTVLVNLTL